LGLPPGPPGGGITDVSPVGGVGARISGSTPGGGHNTPFDLASLSPSGSLACPVVDPSGEIAPRGGIGWVGAQLSATGAGAVWAGGVTGVGGACAFAAHAEAIRNERKSACFVIGGKPAGPSRVPARGDHSFQFLR